MYCKDINKDFSLGTKLGDGSFLCKEINKTSDCSFPKQNFVALLQWKDKRKMKFHPQKYQEFRINSKQNQFKQVKACLTKCYMKQTPVNNTCGNEILLTTNFNGLYRTNYVSAI